MRARINDNIITDLAALLPCLKITLSAVEPEVLRRVEVPFDIQISVAPGAMASSSRPSAIRSTHATPNSRSVSPTTSIPTSSIPVGLLKRSPCSQNSGRERLPPSGRDLPKLQSSSKAHSFFAFPSSVMSNDIVQVEPHSRGGSNQLFHRDHLMNTLLTRPSKTDCARGSGERHSGKEGLGARPP